MKIEYMKRAIELSKKGAGCTNPNPLVGAVIVKEGKIIGEGYHEFYGGPHAEVNAFKNCHEDPKGSEMYVTLEPCSHYGKTPPCANEIVKKGIKKVIIGMKDPNELVCGRGIDILKKAGIEVEVGILENEIRKVNEIFIKYITTKNPFCIMKTAMTLDGKIACKTGDSKWISNEISREYVHKLRHRVSAIMVGIGTVLADNPSLTTRLNNGSGKDAMRVIVDSHGRIPLESKVINVNSAAKTVVAVGQEVEDKKLMALAQKGVQVIKTPGKDGKVDLKYLMNKLGKMGIDSVLLEGGGTLNYSALREGIVDKLMCFIAPKIIGGTDAKTPVEGDGVEFMKECIELGKIEVKNISGDILIEALINNKLCK
ncbi:bifunctional diaminohydroxyphosphoribosylaminopyrimidine deaminase/5-amino-6-(5-phosphoribosylamino)uracil reductase RibD [Haloimpatiens lingqiaonensis]|uniref:bifunctional diaminohydroxyphosphoribosylaminopyrimidine deaminase/5-amino-6-(5-phosphoribosylamino)uracil reductase RibD n=1 Tax=Haloimpatiens lingqiaonensis TaxID=1380675 RepID=UPI0010FDD4D2|nr:bifunctional diaminohydroxyphosphoribosylaminopyrimidine deaminase/5-amino-6-(5-phosphoribosylamino)uracil reductase RibD [Haloimpatiens lingqiaonensis]